MTTMLEQATQGASVQVLELKRRVYGALLGPGLALGIVMIQFAVPRWSLAWWISMSTEGLYAGLIVAFLLRRLTLQTFEWSMYIAGSLLFLGLMLLPPARDMVGFAVTAPMLYIWTFMTFGTRRGVWATSAFFVASLLIYALAVPVTAAGLRLFTLFSLATPIYLAFLYAFATVLEGQAAATLGAVAQQAYRDPLTKLPNRLKFGEHLSASLRAGQPLALMFIDLDNFKAVNDGLGHQAGDQLLSELARRWQRLLPPGEVLARISGDEFGLICPGLSAETVPARADQLLAALEKPFSLAGRDYRASASIGIGLFPQPATTAEELLRHADEAMYLVKASGKNGAQVYQGGLARVRVK